MWDIQVKYIYYVTTNKDNYGSASDLEVLKYN